ncbi:MAG: hypothetical protein LQ352_002380 [Teloschistes flavicans]|nr:MAG: hypothetical protein LQ352_002380 [Teloschistes flavicans]
MPSFKAFLTRMVAFTFACTAVVAAPTVYHNGTYTPNFSNGTGLDRGADPKTSMYGDHAIRVSVYPGDGCTLGPTTFDYFGTGGSECWNYWNAVSVHVIAQ